MSKVRDGILSPNGAAFFKNFTALPGGDGIPARVVPWPEGAPDITTVPGAGDRVTWKYGARNAYVVTTGIPHYSDLAWRLWCSIDGVGQRQLEIAHIEPYVEPVPEKTYTETEIRNAYDAEPQYQASDLIDQLRRDVG